MQSIIESNQRSDGVLKFVPMVVVAIMMVFGVNVLEGQTMENVGFFFGLWLLVGFGSLLLSLGCWGFSKTGWAMLFATVCGQSSVAFYVNFI